MVIRDALVGLSPQVGVAYPMIRHSTLGTVKVRLSKDDVMELAFESVQALRNWMESSDESH